MFPEGVCRLPRAAPQSVLHVREILAEVERYCRSDGYLLALAPPADGGAPVPWPRCAAGQDLPA